MTGELHPSVRIVPADDGDRYGGRFPEARSFRIELFDGKEWLAPSAMVYPEAFAQARAEWLSDVLRYAGQRERLRRLQRDHVVREEGGLA